MYIHTHYSVYVYTVYTHTQTLTHCGSTSNLATWRLLGKEFFWIDEEILQRPFFSWGDWLLFLRVWLQNNFIYICIIIWIRLVPFLPLVQIYVCTWHVYIHDMCVHVYIHISGQEARKGPVLLRSASFFPIIFFTVVKYIQCKIYHLTILKYTVKWY